MKVKLRKVSLIWKIWNSAIPKTPGYVILGLRRTSGIATLSVRQPYFYLANPPSDVISVGLLLEKIPRINGIMKS